MTYRSLLCGPHANGLLMALRVAFCGVIFSIAASSAFANQSKPSVKDVIVVFKTHFDIGYTAMARDVVQQYRTTMIDRALAACDQSRDMPPEQRFTWTLPGWPMKAILDDWQGQTPERKRRLLQAFQDGRFVVHAVPFTVHTELLETEDLVRGLDYSSSLCRATGQSLPRDAKMTDVPCHTWLMPTLLKHAGVDFFCIGCNHASRAATVPILFWWQGPDGSRVLTMYIAPGYGTDVAPPKDWPYSAWLAIIHTGDNHGPPRPDEVRRTLDEAKRRNPTARVRIGRMSDFADAILAAKPTLPVVRGDMFDTWIHGPMSDPAGARIARNTRPMIAAAESLDTQLHAWGITSDIRPTIATAYENSLLYGEHTWGGSIGWIGNRIGYGDRWKARRDRGDFRQIEASWAEHTAYIESAQQQTASLLGNGLQTLAKAIDVAGPRIVVYNPLPWNRNGVVSVSLEGLAPDVTGVRSTDGPQTITADATGRTLRFFAKDIPALGYRTYIPVRTEGKILGKNESSSSARLTLEGPWFKAELEPDRMDVASLVDKRSGRELVNAAAEYKLGQYLYQRFDKDEVAAYTMAATKHHPPHVDFCKPEMPSAKDCPHLAISPNNGSCRVDRSAVADTAVLRAPASKELPCAVTLRLVLWRDEPCLDLELTLHNKPFEPLPEAGWMCLPLKINQPQFRLGRLGSVVDPSRDVVAGNRRLFSLSTGMTVFDPQLRGVGLCPLDSPLVSLDSPGCWQYATDFTARTASIFVNLFNNQWSTNFRLWNSGTWTSRVRLWPVAGHDTEADLVTPSLEARSPLLAAVADGSAGSLPSTRTGVELSRRGVALTAFGPSLDGPGTILRLWELAGRGGPCSVRLPDGIRAAGVQPVDLRGVPRGNAIPVAKRSFTFDLPAFAPASFLIDSKP
ncbi:MAG: hypothetical protein LLG00_13815 [Planctomycetaceae bacterium]|nr:hypothetical protein [Planctomycetaceae bacterium]